MSRTKVLLAFFTLLCFAINPLLFAGPVRAQTPKAPYPYLEEEVSYENKRAGITLSGTLTLPKGKGPFPAVVIIAGKGPNDRDGKMCGHQPYLVWADHLTRQGVAVLRFDKRGVAKSTGDYASATTDDFASDAVASLDYLKTRKEIDRDQIGLVGHSEGGMIAPIAALKSKGVAFVVSMAAPGVAGEEIALVQAALIQKADGATDGMIAHDQKLRKRLIAAIKNLAPKEELSAMIKDHWAGIPQEERMISHSGLQLRGDNAEEISEVISSPWFRNFLKYDPAETLKRLQIPVLAVHGDLDLQVSASQNLPAIARALEEGGHGDYAVVRLPGLNHLFQTCKSGSAAEYAAIEETTAPRALQVMSDWILTHTHQRVK